MTCTYSLLGDELNEVRHEDFETGVENEVGDEVDTLQGMRPTFVYDDSIELMLQLRGKINLGTKMKRVCTMKNQHSPN